jgi:hypothetical protein
MWHHTLSITYERGAASWQAVQVRNENSIRLRSCKTTVNVLDSCMHRQDWCTNLICNHQFVPRNYKVYCTSMSIRNKTWPHSIIDRVLWTLQSVRCTSAHAATKRNNRTLRSSEQLFCFVLGMTQVQTSAKRMTTRYTSSFHSVNPRKCGDDISN